MTEKEIRNNLLNAIGLDTSIAISDDTLEYITRNGFGIEQNGDKFSVFYDDKDGLKKYRKRHFLLENETLAYVNKWAECSKADEDEYLYEMWSEEMWDNENY